MKWAVTLYILDRIGARTIFATHFHELTKIEHDKLTNFSLDVVEKDGRIIFLKRVKPGAADSSYGVHVAELAGIPEEVIRTARFLQGGFGSPPVRTQVPTAESKETERELSKQPLLFSLTDLVIDALKGLAIEKMRPLDALALLARWQEELMLEESNYSDSHKDTPRPFDKAQDRRRSGQASTQSKIYKKPE
jgi:DNA mismatch repair protein MutS